MTKHLKQAPRRINLRGHKPTDPRAIAPDVRWHYDPRTTSGSWPKYVYLVATKGDPQVVAFVGRTRRLAQAFITDNGHMWAPLSILRRQVVYCGEGGPYISTKGLDLLVP
jgi:hypothetical protein